MIGTTKPMSFTSRAAAMTGAGRSSRYAPTIAKVPTATVTASVAPEPSSIGPITLLGTRTLNSAPTSTNAKMIAPNIAVKRRLASAAG